MTTPDVPSIPVLDYLRKAFQQDQISAFVTQNPDGTLVITADIGPGSSNLFNEPLIGARGNAGAAQFPLLLEPDIFPVTSDLPGPGVLLNTAADIGKFWMIAQQDDNGNYISVGAYIWYGLGGFRFLPFGPVGPPGPYPVIQPQVTLLPPDQFSQQVVTPATGGGTAANPYISMFNLSIPEGPVGTGPPLANMADFEPLQPTVGQFITATGQNVTYQGQVLPQWAPANTGDLPMLPYIVPQSMFLPLPGNDFTVVGATNILNAILALIAAFIGIITSVIQDVLDFVMNILTGGAMTRGNSPTTVHAALSGVATNVNTLTSAMGSSFSSSSQLQNVAFALNTFGGTVTTPIQNAADATANSLGIAGSGHSLATVANAVTYSLQPIAEHVTRALKTPNAPGPGIPTIASFAVPPQPFPWKPLVFGQIRMSAEGGGAILGTQLIGAQVCIGFAGGQQIARGFGHVLNRVVTIVPHTSSAGNPSLAMNPWNGLGTIPANTPGALFVNLVNDGPPTKFSYIPADAQLIVLTCPVTTQAQLGLGTPAALHTRLSLQAASVHSP
jgi:hypothetical protein